MKGTREVCGGGCGLLLLLLLLVSYLVLVGDLQQVVSIAPRAGVRLSHAVRAPSVGGRERNFPVSTGTRVT